MAESIAIQIETESEIKEKLAKVRKEKLEKILPHIQGVFEAYAAKKNAKLNIIENNYEKTFCISKADRTIACSYSESGGLIPIMVIDEYADFADEIVEEGFNIETKNDTNFAIKI